MPTALSERLLGFLTGTPPAAPPAEGDAGDALRFDGVDLRADAVRLLVGDPPAAWWDGAGGRVRVVRAALPGVSLRGANLTGVSLEHADLKGADLADGVLHNAVLGGADLTGALLEDADLRGAHLRFALLTSAALEGANCRGADLWGAKCHEADLDKIDFRGAELEEADLRETDARECDFRDARLGQTDFRGADLRRSDFRGAALRGTKFDGADLRLANLESADLTGCTLAHAWGADARLERTRLAAGQLGGAIGEELAGEWAEAARGYQTLERNFAGLGDPEAASWAYRKRRRMQKKDAGQSARADARAGRYAAALPSGAYWAGDWLVDLVCDYGDSVGRVFLTYLLVVVGFGAGYAAAGAVVRDQPDDTRAVTRTFDDVALYSLTAMLAPTDPPEGLHPATGGVQLATVAQSGLGIFLLGLLGFVAGNRIRR